MKTIIIVDLEATCSEKRDITNEIIEIGAVKIKNGEIIDTFDEFVRPVLNPKLTDFCKKLTTITQEDVDSAEIFPVVLEKFIKWIGETDFTLVSWGYYDKSQFVKDCALHKLDDSFTKDHINLKAQFAEMKKVKPCGMEKALRIMRLALDGTHHRGIDDAKNIAKIYLSMKEK